MRHIAPICTALALLGAVASSAPAGSAAADATDSPVLFGPPARLKAARIVKFSVGCSTRCDLTTSNVLHLPDRDLGPLVVDPEPLEKGAYVWVTVGLNRAAKQELADNAGRSRLRTTITATDLETGHETVVNHSFRFKIRSGP
jgi:hypothetical protein